MRESTADAGSPLPEGLVVRRLAPSDSIADLTALIHRAYASLGGAGMNFTGVDQNEATTRERCAHGETFVAQVDGHVVGTLTLGLAPSMQGYGEHVRPGAVYLEQFAVEPTMKGHGVGRALATAAEARARELRAPTILGDTSERAAHLIALYARAGYRVVGHVQWPGKTYRSVVLEKALSPEKR